MANKKSYALTIYLIKENYTKIPEIVKEGLNEEIIGEIGNFYYKGSYQNPPKWGSLFEGYSFPLFSSSASGLFLVKTNNRFLALAFGPEGRHFLNKGVTEERFGLITTLNSVKEKSIRSIDTKTLESEGLQTRIQSAQPVAADAFGFDVEKDLLRSVVGESEDKELGGILAGKDSLRVSLACNIGNLKYFLEKVLNNYKKNDYKDKFPWVDNLKEIQDVAKINKLNTQLVVEINKESLGKIWITIPEILDWNDHGGFKYSSRKSDDGLFDDVHIKTFKEHLGGNVISLDDLLTGTLFRFSQTNQYSKDHWRVYDCIYFEHSEGEETYFLTSGKWYAVNNSLVSEVNSYYSSLPKEKFGIIFPDYNHTKESEYNQELANKNTALVVDANNLTIIGRSTFEFCDVYTKNRQLIHIKKYSGSSALSHLFNQGYVSANFFLDEEFRKKINTKLLTDDFAIKDVSIRPNSTETGDYTIIFGVISKTDSPLDIPFFSKMTLMHVAKTLKNWGFKISLVKIKNLKPDKNDI